MFHVNRNLLLSELTVSAPCVCAFSSPKLCARCEENNNSILRRCHDQDWISILSFIGLRVVCSAYLFQFVRCSSHNWSHFPRTFCARALYQTLISPSKKQIYRFWVIIEISKWRRVSTEAQQSTINKWIEKKTIIFDETNNQRQKIRKISKNIKKKFHSKDSDWERSGK